MQGCIHESVLEAIETLKNPFQGFLWWLMKSNYTLSFQIKKIFSLKAFGNPQECLKTLKIVPEKNFQYAEKRWFKFFTSLQINMIVGFYVEVYKLSQVWYLI